MSQLSTREMPVIGIYDDEQSAQAAVASLKAAGFTDEHIGVVRQSPQATERENIHTANFTDASGKSAAVGVAVGAGTGALWGLGILSGFLPGIGPAIAGGILASLLANTAVGLAAGGLVGAFVGLGIPTDEAERYADEVKNGKTIVTVRTDDKVDVARAILSQSPPFFIS